MPSQKSDNSNKSEPSTTEHTGEHTLFVGSRNSLIGGFLAGAIALSGQWLVGQVYSGWEARQLLESVISSALYFGSATVTGSATILALMLTMLGLTNTTDGEFDSIFFKRIERIGLLSTITLIAGVLLMLFLSVPVQESKDVPASWYKIIYYVLISYIAILSGLIVGVVLMLFNAIRSLIDVVKPSADEDQKDAEEREKSESPDDKEEIDESGNTEEN